MPSVYLPSTTRTRRYDIQTGGVSVQTRLGPNGHMNTPTKANGGFIVLPNGSRFRRTTNYSRSRVDLELGSAGREDGVRRNISTSPLYNVWLRDSAGGWTPDAVMSSNLYTAFSGVPEVGFGLQGIIAVPTIPLLSGNEAKTKALLKLADSTANMGENLATLGQTLRMLHNPVHALTSGIRKVWKDRSLRPYIRECRASLERKGLLNPAAERYLEYVYGWKPLMQDIYGLMEMAKQTGQRPLFVSGSHTAKRSFALKPKTWNNSSESRTIAVSSGTATSKVRCKLYARIDPEWSGTRALNQLGLVNPLALAWELTSLSFVVDWILPIGQVLNALTASAGLTFVNGSISNRLSCDASYTDASTLIKGRANWSYQGAIPSTGNIRYNGYTRQEITGWPLPGVWIDPDPLRLNSEKSDRDLKAIALLITSLNSGR